jgi:hypothetical protein
MPCRTNIRTERTLYLRQQTAERQLQRGMRSNLRRRRLLWIMPTRQRQQRWRLLRLVPMLVLWLLQPLRHRRRRLLLLALRSSNDHPRLNKNNDLMIYIYILPSPRLITVLLPPFSFIRRELTCHRLLNHILATHFFYIILLVVMNLYLLESTHLITNPTMSNLHVSSTRCYTLACCMFDCLICWHHPNLCQHVFATLPENKNINWLLYNERSSGVIDVDLMEMQEHVR